MPQLDTSTWFTMILSMFLVLFIIFQLKISKHNFYYNPELTSTKHQNKTPLEKQNERKSICLFHCPYNTSPPPCYPHCFIS